MGSQNWHEERILQNKFAYQVLRQTAINEEGNYSSEIARTLGKGGQEDTTRLLRKMLDLELVRKGKRTKAQYYRINYDKLPYFFKQIWDLEEPLFNGFKKFLEKYCENYFLINKDSSVGKMLQDDFLQGLHIYFNQEKREDQEELKKLYSRLLEKREVKESPVRFIEDAVRELDGT